jgi:type II secretory pathway pseudopilin PulG
MVASMPIGKIVITKKHTLGFTFIGLLIIISISGILLSAVGIVWNQDSQRNKEQELLYVGDAYQKAIQSYYDTSPNGNKQYPQKLEELLLDKRFPSVKRHIRVLYPNPFSKDHAWTLIIQTGRIKGVTTQSELTPIKTAGFSKEYEHFSKAKTYADWQFIYEDQATQLNQSFNQQVN